ncbi:MAG TPA: BMP family ABC transporter substrate-binding protein [Ilumatobacteraceae bacterium]
MGRSPRAIAVLLAGLLVTAAAACGSSDKAATTTTAAATTIAAVATTAAPAGSAATTPGTSTAGSTAGTAANGKALSWTMVTDQAGLGDKGFNDLAYAGIQKAAADLGGKAQAIESSEQAQYVPNLEQSVDDGASMTVGVGFLLTDALVQVATEKPNAKFVSIDSDVLDADGKPIPNVASVTFKENEAAYLAGIIAGKTTKANKIGFVGGLEIPPVVRFLKGFQAGLASVNPAATVSIAYVGGFTDPVKTKSLAAADYDAGADIVFEVAGGGGLGAYEEAKARGKGFWVIGTDTCKEALAPDNFLTSATKDVSGAVFKEAQAVANGTFKGGQISLGLKDGGVGVCQDNFASLPADVQAAVKTATTAVSDGTITVPSQ